MKNIDYVKVGRIFSTIVIFVILAVSQNISLIEVILVCSLIIVITVLSHIEGLKRGLNKGYEKGLQHGTLQGIDPEALAENLATKINEHINTTKDKKEVTLDDLLDKVSSIGYEKLSQEEKELLKKLSK